MKKAHTPAKPARGTASSTSARKPASQKRTTPVEPPVPAEDPQVTLLREANEQLRKDAADAKAKAEASEKAAKEALEKAESAKGEVKAISKSKVRVAAESPATWVLALILIAVVYIFVSGNFPVKVADAVETVSATDQENARLRQEIEARDKKEVDAAKAKLEADEAAEKQALRDQIAAIAKASADETKKLREELLAAINSRNSVNETAQVEQPIAPVSQGQAVSGGSNASAPQLPAGEVMKTNLIHDVNEDAGEPFVCRMIPEKGGMINGVYVRPLFADYNGDVVLHMDHGDDLEQVKRDIVWEKIQAPDLSKIQIMRTVVDEKGQILHQLCVVGE